MFYFILKKRIRGYKDSEKKRLLRQWRAGPSFWVSWPYLRTSWNPNPQILSYSSELAYAWPSTWLWQTLLSHPWSRAFNCFASQTYLHYHHLHRISYSQGSHYTLETDHCVFEAASWFAGLFVWPASLAYDFGFWLLHLGGRPLCVQCPSIHLRSYELS